MLAEIYFHLFLLFLLLPIIEQGSISSFLKNDVYLKNYEYDKEDKLYGTRDKELTFDLTQKWPIIRMYACTYGIQYLTYCT